MLGLAALLQEWGLAAPSAHARTFLCLAGGDIDAAHMSEQLISCCELTSSTMILFLVCMQAAPLVWAATNGMHVLGAELAIPSRHRLSIAQRWAEFMISGAGAVTYLAGRSRAGSHVFVAPVALNPELPAVASSPTRRRQLLRNGHNFAWLTLAALAGTATFEMASHAAFACSALRDASGALPSSALPGQGATFRFGVTEVRSLVETPSDLPLAPTQLDSALARCFQEGRYLSDLLLSDDSVDCEYLAEWAGQIGPPPINELPQGILSQLPSFDTTRFDGVALPAIVQPRTLAWMPRMPRPPPMPDGLCVTSPSQLMPHWRWRGVVRWLRRMLDDLVCVRDEGTDCDRRRPGVLVVGQLALHEWARNRVFDFRLSPSRCATYLDTHAPLDHTLNVDYFRRRLRDYPNQRILSFIAEGVRIRADVELQTVLVPHLLSLANGFSSVVKELKRMSTPELNWYSLHASFPFWPLYCLGEGAQPRKLEDRWRRCEEGGAPRHEVCDESGLRALSLNEASMTHHFPQHFAADTRPEWLDYLAKRHLPPTAEMVAAVAANRGTKWERQRMPTLAQAMRALVVLSRAAHLLGESIYVVGDDVKDYFNHLTHASEELYKMNIVFINSGDVDDPEFSAPKGSLVFINEKRMGFGLHPNSMIAQEFSEVLMHLLRQDVDSVEDPIAESDPRESMRRYLEMRRAVERRTGAHERRLYSCLMYCDDGLLIIVGAARTIRILKIWRKLVTDAGLIMAIPKKRTVGVWCVWIGAIIFAGLGVVAVPRSKILRSSAAIVRLCQSGIEFCEYRSLMGLLEHVRCIARVPKRYTHGLYAPHGADGEGRLGPNTIVRPNPLMSRQFQRWLEILTGACGCVITNVLRRFEIASDLVATFLTASDAATDSHPPGMGGFCHGFWWQYEVAFEHLQWLHITVLELLACAFNMIITSSLLPPRARMLQMVDATSAFYTLADESEHSEVLICAHEALLDCHAFNLAAERTDLVHGAGDANVAGDAASRSQLERLQALGAAIKVRLTRLSLPPECEAIYFRVLDFARSRGRRVRVSHRPPTPTMPPSGRSFLEHLEMALGQEFSSRVEMDGPPARDYDFFRAISEHLQVDDVRDRLIRDLERARADQMDASLLVAQCHRGYNEAINDIASCRAYQHGLMTRHNALLRRPMVLTLRWQQTFFDIEMCWEAASRQLLQAQQRRAYWREQCDSTRAFLRTARTRLDFFQALLDAADAGAHSLTFGQPALPLPPQPADIPQPILNYWPDFAADPDPDGNDPELAVLLPPHPIEPYLQGVGDLVFDIEHAPPSPQRAAQPLMPPAPWRPDVHPPPCAFASFAHLLHVGPASGPLFVSSEPMPLSRTLGSLPTPQHAAPIARRAGAGDDADDNDSDHGDGADGNDGGGGGDDDNDDGSNDDNGDGGDGSDGDRSDGPNLGPHPEHQRLGLNVTTLLPHSVVTPLPGTVTTW